MVEITHCFDDSAAYECFMGRWSRAIGEIFLEWAAPPTGARWLDVGCGTGVFTELILDTRSPATVVAIDPEKAQIDYACRQLVSQRANFQIADAQALPFPDATFDIVASALAINFIPDRRRALSEMRRVARPSGLVAGYVWDFLAELSPSWPLRRAMRRIGVNVPEMPGTAESSFGALRALFESAGFEEIATTAIEVTQQFVGFEDFWQAQTSNYVPTTKTITAMAAGDRIRLIEAVRAELPVRQNGAIQYFARANAIKARVPGKVLRTGHI